MEQFILDTDVGEEIYAIMKTLDFRYTINQIMSMSRRDISILIGMFAYYKSELKDRR